MIKFYKDWIYIVFKDLLYISLCNPFKTMNKIKKVFKSLKCYFKFSKEDYAPYPILWVSKPHFIHIVTRDVSWKDKYDSPRYEGPPYIWIHIYKWNCALFWSLPLHQQQEIDQYWEQALWYLYYSRNISYGTNIPNIDKARESWPWQNFKTEESTWTDKFLIK